MKKLLLIASALLAFTFFGCDQPSNPSSPDTGKSDVATPEAKPTELVIFDPATYDGETVEIDGETFAVFTVDGYNTYFQIDPVDCSAATEISAKVCGKEADSGKQFLVGIKNSGYEDVTSITMNPIVDTPTVLTGEIGDIKTVGVIQPMVQSTADWSAQSGVVVYVGKITAK
jgi:hypothetical protein